MKAETTTLYVANSERTPIYGVSIGGVWSFSTDSQEPSIIDLCNQLSGEDSDVAGLTAEGILYVTDLLPTNN